MIEWDIASWEGGSASITARIESVENAPTANIERLNETLFEAIIYDSYYGSNKLVEKRDASLIELMNWVEEELKFRNSHNES